uniref:TRF2/HOY1 PH-like domain-containing protein n=1 Tax=Opuntia streptacantha TaxID=393608 RepID=A0A7C9E191_OPUST
MIHFESAEDRRMSPVRARVPVKVEIEDPLEDAHAPSTKKQKQAPDQNPAENNLFPVAPSLYNPLNEPSPLGLRLRKSPSLLELIQMRLSQGTSPMGSMPSDCFKPQGKTEAKGSATSGGTDKLKASNFPASLLRIGSWEYGSRYEGDLVAKCYFAKHKLVWEILEGGLKSKIEIQWSDIMGLKADFPDDAPATLVVLLVRQPLFFRETNPQPRKHTLWQATADFTDGQASLHRKHFLQVPHGLLNKHFEKLIQCDTRLNFLSRQPETTLECPYFESQPCAADNPNESNNHEQDRRESTRQATFSIFEDVATPSASQSSSITIKQEDAGAAEAMSREASSPSSVMDMRIIEGSASCESGKLGSSKSFEQLIMQGLRPSMSMTDLVNHLGNCISEQTSIDNLSFTEEGSESRKVLEAVAQHLLSDFQFTPCSDEKSLMSRVNSLCSLLQKDGTPFQSSNKSEGINDVKPDCFNPKSDQATRVSEIIPSEEGSGDAPNCKQTSGMPRIDSCGDLLLHLPRIASLPKFLFDISEDSDRHVFRHNVG